MIKTLRRLYSSLGRYRLLYLLSAIELSIMISWSVYTETGINLDADTPTYYSAYTTLITGNIDVCRTPLFPLVIGIPKALFGDPLSVIIVYLLQSLFFLYTIKLLGITLENITHNKRVTYLFTAIYALYPGMLSFCGIMMTESISISMMATVIYLISEAYYHNSSKKALLSGFVCLLLWLQRPSLMPITLIMLLFWICIWLLKRKEMKNIALYGLLSTLASVAVLGVYSIMFYHQYHKVGLTCVSTWNNYTALREANVIEIDKIELPQLKASMDSMLKKNDRLYDNPSSGTKRGMWWFEIYQLQTKYGIAECDKFVNDQIKQHPFELLSYIYHDRLDSLIGYSCVFTGAAMPNPFFWITRIFLVNNGTIFLILLITIFILVSNNIKSRKISYFLWLLVILFIVNYFTIWIGAHNRYDRLSAPNYPIMIAICCWLVDQLATLVTSRE